MSVAERLDRVDVEEIERFAREGGRVVTSFDGALRGLERVLASRWFTVRAVLESACSECDLRTLRPRDSGPAEPLLVLLDAQAVAQHIGDERLRRLVDEGAVHGIRVGVLDDAPDGER